MKVIREFPNYMISEKGFVLNTKTNRYLEGNIGKVGYRVIDFYVKGKKSRKYLHRLLAKYYIPNNDPINKIQVNHIDGNKLNNHLTNLEWVTPSENIQHAYATGLQPYRRKLSKESYKNLLLNDFFKKHKTITKIAKSKSIGLTQLSIHFKELAKKLYLEKEYLEELVFQNKERAKHRKNRVN